MIIDALLCCSARMLRTLPVRQRGQCCEVDLALEPATLAQSVRVLSALADPTRLQIVAALLRAEQEVCVCDLTEAFHLSQPTISHHVARLRRAGLVEATKRGVWIHYRLAQDLSAVDRRIIEAAVS
jgi:DNA-binding transcriptional ArsR family regulator